MAEHGNIHSAINEGFAKACRCYTCPATINGIRQGFPEAEVADAYYWKYMGGQTMILPNDAIAQITDVLHFAGVHEQIEWERFAVYFEGRLQLYDTSRMVRSAEQLVFTSSDVIPEFAGELNDPDILNKLQSLVTAEIEQLVRSREKLFISLFE